MKIGIDFGTTYTKVAYLDAAGNLEAFAFPPGDASSRYVPTATAYRRNGRGLDLVAIGRAARRLAVDEDDIVFFENFKMLLPLKPEAWTAQGWPTDEKTPADVTADFLDRLLRNGEGAFCREGGGRALDSIVMSVPEVWQRSVQNTGAGQLQEIVSERLGLHLSHLQSEPVCAAAALVQERNRASRPMRDLLLVCDVGGGTFDVALCALSGSKITVLDFDGNGYEGVGTSGVMFDRAAARLAYRAETGSDPDLLDPDFKDFLQEFEQTKIHKAAETARLIGLYRGVPAMDDEKLFAIRRKYKLTLAQFDEAFAPIRAGIREVLHRICGRASQRGQAIGEVKIVGGFGQFGPVRQVIFEALGPQVVDADAGPARDTERDHLAICHGAALVANDIIQTEERYPHTIAVHASARSGGRLVEGMPYPIIEAGRVPVGEGNTVRAFATANGQPQAFEVGRAGRAALTIAAKARGEGEWLILDVPAQDLPSAGLYRVGVEVDRSNIASLLFQPVDGGPEHHYRIGRYTFDLLVPEGPSNR